jgi:hypothetical protein
MKLDLGNQVLASDGGDIGRIDRIVLETRTMTVREFVVHQGFLFRHDRFVALNLIDHIDDNGAVHLKLSAEQAQELPEFIGEQHVATFTGTMQSRPGVHILTQQGSVPHDAVVLSHRTQVFDENDVYLGYLDKVEYTSDGRVSHVILHSGDVLLWEMRLPIEAIASVRHDRITMREVLVESGETIA